MCPPKLDCFASLCHHRLVTMSVHMHPYHYPLFESGTKIGLWTIPLCRKDNYVGKIKYYYVNANNNSKIDFLYNNNWCIAAYGKLIVGVLQPMVKQ